VIRLARPSVPAVRHTDTVRLNGDSVALIAAMARRAAVGAQDRGNAIAACAAAIRAIGTRKGEHET
jgi:uncharacterized protein (UPF0261 family)